MKTISVILGLLALAALLPAASASLPVPPVPADVCIEGRTDSSCYGGNTVCVTVSRQVPQCVDLCTECIGPIDPNLPPLVGVCVEGVTHANCYRFKDVCISVSEMVPQCVDVCDGCFDVRAPVGPPLVSVCVEGRTDPSCYGYNSVCVEVSQMVPKCVDLDAAELPSLAEAQRRCLDYYFDLEAGPVYYRQPNSCTRELYVNGDRVL